MDTREWFEAASTGFRVVTADIAESDLERPGLGEWDVRSLLGHTCRAFITIETYLAAERPDRRAPPITPAEYYGGLAAGLVDPAEVARRGHQAGAELGRDPVQEALAIADRVVALVGRTPDAACLMTRLGAMTFIDFLSTRALELTVHGIDLAGALGRPMPDELECSLRPCLALLCDAASPEQQLSILLAVTGRGALSGDFTIL